MTTRIGRPTRPQAAVLAACAALVVCLLQGWHGAAQAIAVGLVVYATVPEVRELVARRDREDGHR